MTSAVTLDGQSLDIDTVNRIACGRLQVEIAEQSRHAIGRGRAIVDRYIEQGIPAYGLNTGLGARVGETLPAADLTRFSYHLVRGRAQAVGALLDPQTVRTIMAIRLNTMLTGAAGASVEVAEMLCEALNRNLIAAMPSTGSIGAGDLVVMAALPHALIGEGDMLVDGRRVAAADVLMKENVQALSLGPKDGLLLCNNPCFSIAGATMSAIAARHCVDALQIAVALSFEGFRGNTTPLSASVAGIRPQHGQTEAAQQLRKLLDGGDLLDPGKARRLQDPLSFRCVAQVNGSALAALHRLGEALQIEINSCADSPVVLIDEDRIVTSGNFHVPQLSLALDTLARALAWAATDSVSRIQRMMTSALSDLPPLLSSQETRRAGFAPILKPIEALRAEIIHLSDPVPVLPSFNADGIEDSLTLAPQAAKKLNELAAKLSLLASCELAAATQAIDLAKPERIGTRLQAAYRAVRDICPPLIDDRPIGREIEQIANDLVAGGQLARIVGLYA